MSEEETGQYPNCEQLILQLAVILDAQRMVQELPDTDQYDDYICAPCMPVG